MGVKRVGVFGGTFDPPHVAHIALAQSALDALALDEVRLVVSGQSWQKSEVSSAADRAAMVALAIEGHRQFCIDRRELDRHGPSYTVDTLGELRAELGAESVIALLIGSDQYRNLPTWQRADRLLELANIAVARRATDAGALPAASPLTRAQGQTVSFPMPAYDVSASAIRAALHTAARTMPETRLVHPAVLAYIRSHRLYLPTA